MIQSFAPGEVSYEEAHRIGKELADKVLGGKYEYVLTTHIDKGHIHNHIIFCAVDFATHHKYISNKKSYYQIWNESDRLCKEHGLSVVTPWQDKGKKYAEWDAERRGTSWKAKLKALIDVTIPKAKDFDDFLWLMEAAGYEVKRGKFVSFRAPWQERFTHSKTLGEAYTVEAITERIAGTYRAKPKALRQEKAGISMLIDIQNSIKAAESRGFEQWAKIHNLKQAAKNCGKLPGFKTLHTEYKELTEKKDKLYQEYGKLKKKVKQYDTIKQNVDSILRQAKQPEREKQTER